MAKQTLSPAHLETVYSIHFMREFTTLENTDIINDILIEIFLYYKNRK